MKRGFCSHPAKQTRIVTEWKCVDIQFPKDITNDELTKRKQECKVKDYYGVCDLCKFFTAEGTQAAGSPQEPKKPSAYTAPEEGTASAELSPKTDKPADDPQWDSMMDEMI